MVSPIFLFSYRALNHFLWVDIGEVWANMLHVIYAELVNKYGWSPASRSNPDGREGNVVWMHLFIDSFAIQPCGPTCKSIPFFQ